MAGLLRRRCGFHWLQVLLLFSLLGCTRLAAHQPGLSTVAVQLRTNSLECDLIVAWREIEEVIPLDSDQNGELSADELASAKPRLVSLGEEAVEFDCDGAPLKRLSVAVQAEDSTGIRFLSRWDLPASPKVLLIRSQIIKDLQRGHHQVVSVRGVTNSLLAEYAMTRERNLLEVPLDETAEPHISAFGQFVWLGVEHILIGWDHLAFLFALLLVSSSMKDAVKIITSFTVAHSITLALATYDLIRLPSTFVEAVIAASIVYVAIENLVRSTHRWRPALTFAFGLVHGIGFATILRDMGIGGGAGGALKPLLGFNIGVELGQVAIAFIVLPLMWRLSAAYPRRWVPAASIAVALLGGWFLLERTLL